MLKRLVRGPRSGGPGNLAKQHGDINKVIDFLQLSSQVRGMSLIVTPSINLLGLIVRLYQANNYFFCLTRVTDFAYNFD